MAWGHFCWMVSGPQRKSQSIQRPATTWLGLQAYVMGQVLKESVLELIRFMKIQIWPCGGRAQYRDNGSCPPLPSPYSHTTQLLPILLWCTPSASNPLSLLFPSPPPTSPCPLAGAQGECLWVSLCTGPLRRHLCFQQPLFHPKRWNFCWLSYSDVICVLFPSTGILGSGAWGGSGTPGLWGGPSVAEISR